MLEAIIAANRARKSADLAEQAATDSRGRNPYETALSAYREALRQDSIAVQAARRLKERIPEIQAKVAAEGSVVPHDGTVELSSGTFRYESLKVV